MAKAPAATAEIYEYDARRSFGAKILSGLGDLLSGVRLAPIWLTLGWWDFKRSTRRTALGPLWSIVGTGFTVLVLGYVYGAVLDVSASQQLPYLAAGMIIWFFISSCITGGLSAYISARGVLTERNLPVAFSAFRYVFRFICEFAVKCVVFALVALYVQLPLTETMLLAIPGILLLAANGLWVVLALAPLGARFRDLSQMMGPLMLVAFLASPVIWSTGALRTNHFIALLNPFTHFLAIVRDPLLGSAPPMTSVIVTVAILIVGWFAAITCHCLTKDRVVYWL